jgi:hypothetical protein
MNLKTGELFYAAMQQRKVIEMCKGGPAFPEDDVNRRRRSNLFLARRAKIRRQSRIRLSTR